MNNPDRVEVSFGLNYATILIGSVITVIVAACICIFVSISIEKKIELVIQSVLAGSAITALYYAAFNFRMMSNQHLENSKYEKKKISASLITEFNKPEYSKIRFNCLRIKDEIKNLSPVETLAYIEDSDEKRAAVVSTLNFFEQMETLILAGAADDEVLRDFFCVIAKNNYHGYKNYIMQKRILLHNNSIFLRLEQMAERWK